MNKQIIALFAFIILISTVSAQTSYVFAKDTYVDLKISCFDINNSLCSSLTPCQATIHYPNQTNLIKN
jgi:hypothetical protein